MSGRRFHRLRRASCWVLGWALLGTTIPPVGRAEVARPPGPTDERPSISLLTRVRRADDSVATIQEGGALRSGDEVSLFIHVNRPTVVHLIWISPNGVAVQLFPFARGTELVRPGAEVRVPANPAKSLTVDDVVGTERFLLIATQRPLAAARPDLAKAVQVVVSTERWPANVLRDGDESVTGARRSWVAGGARGMDPHPGPEAPMDFSRGGCSSGTMLDPGASGRALNLQADSKGNAVASVTFRHLH